MFCIIGKSSMKKRNDTVFAELNLIHKNSIEIVCMQNVGLNFFYTK